MTRSVRQRYENIADDLVGISDIAESTGVVISTVSNWAVRWDDFPRRIDKISGMPIYARDEVDACLRRHGRNPYWKIRVRIQ